MIFIHKETAEIFELMIVSINETDLWTGSEDDRMRVYTLGAFVLHNPLSMVIRREDKVVFTDLFDILGFL